MSEERVNHPAHYGGKDNVYEAIKVIDAWGLDFCLGNAAKYISRAGKKAGAGTVEDLRKAAWYLNRAIEQRAGEPASTEPSPTPTCTHDIEPGDISALRKRLACCNGVSSDCTVLVWEQSQALVALFSRIEAACGIPDPAETCRVILGLLREGEHA